MLTQILFNDEQTIIPKLLIIPDNTDPMDVYEKAATLAKNDKHECMSHNIPDKYWILAGAKLLPEPVKTVDISSHGIYTVPSCVELITCRTCDHFNNGYCCKYDSGCDPDKPEEDCYTRNQQPPLVLKYNDEIVERFIYEDGEYTDTTKDLKEIQTNMPKIIQDLIDKSNRTSNTSYNTVEWLNYQFKCRHTEKQITPETFDQKLFTIGF